MNKKKTKGGYIHGVYVSAKTKEEFRKNKEDFRNEGIKSAYSLQKQKNIATQTLKIERGARRQAIKNAYELEKEKFIDIGYDLEYFLQQFKIIEEYNQKIKKGIKSGKILSDTPLAAFPIHIETGKINLKRLQREVKKTNKSINQIQKKQYEIFFNNVSEVFGADVAELTRNVLSGVQLEKIYIEFSNDVFLSFLADYDIDNFSDDAQEQLWKPMQSYISHYLDILEDFRREVDYK